MKRRIINFLLIFALFASVLPGVTNAQTKAVSIVEQTGISKVWNLKDANGQMIKGNNIKVAVVDTGFDPGLPELEHPGFKGTKYSGYDFITRSTNIVDTQGHGTHVAGIIKKCAPNVEFLFYRAIGSINQISILNICAAIDRAIEDGADVINLSLGIPSFGAASNPFKRVIDKATKKGVVVVVAAGNDGGEVGSLNSIIANRNNVITVGATTKVVSVPTLNIGSISIEALKTDNEIKRGTYPVVEVKSSKELRKAKGKLALVNRSDLDMGTLVEANLNGVVGIIGVNNSPGEWDGSDLTGGLSQLIDPQALAPFVTISKVSGVTLRKALVKNNKLTVSSMKKERMASFSSSGPAAKTHKNPDLAAPGQDIRSSFPLSMGVNKVLSGTSMATPVVVGAVALLKQAHPSWDPQRIKAALSNTCTSLKNSLQGLFSPRLQGSGRIDVFSAVNNEVFTTPNQLIFNLKVPKKKNNLERKVVLDNTSSKEKKYLIKVRYVEKKSGLVVNVPKTMVISKKTSKDLVVKVVVPAKTPRGVYTGYVDMVSNDGNLTIPYSVCIGM